MKRTILSMLLGAVAMCGWAANNDKTLKVKLDIVDFGDTVVVIRSILNKEETFIGKDGKFEFELEVDIVCNGILVQPKLLRGEIDDMRYYSLPLVGGESVRVWDTDKTRYDVDGTGFYADYHKMDLFNENASKEYHANADKLRQMKSKEEYDNFYQKVFQPSLEQYQEALVGYIKAHSSQEAAMCLLNNMDLDKMKKAYLLFDSTVREGRMKPLYEGWVKNAEERLKAEAEEKKAEEKQAAGLEAPAFTLNDLEGKPLSLASLRGKYVILDFWGSWCVWCIKGFPQMKEYYAKYPGKFEILGVDCNDTEDLWRAAVKKHELPWLHVYCPKGATILADYGITGFPTKIIIGPDGKIVKSIIGEDPSFYTLLDELFGK